MRLVVTLVLVACSQGNGASREVTGTLALDGQQLTVRECRAGRGVTTFVELVTDSGKLRFEDKRLFWSQDNFARGAELSCDKLDRSWGGGSRTDGTHYFRGHLIFACRGPAGRLTGDVTVDCGKITKDERASLDKNRQDMLDEQAAAKRDRCDDVGVREHALFPDAKSAAAVACREGKWPSATQDCLIAAVDAAAWATCLPTDGARGSGR